MSEAPAEPVTEAQASEPGGRRRIQRFVLLLLFYVAAGPPVGSVIFFSLVAITKIETPMDAAYALLAPFVGLMFSPFSYLLGALPAAFGGLFVACWQAFCGRISFIGIVVLGFVLGLAFVHATDGLGGLTQKVVDWKAVIVSHLSAMLPTLICWYPVRKRYFPPPGSGPAAVKT